MKNKESKKENNYIRLWLGNLLLCLAKVKFSGEDHAHLRQLHYAHESTEVKLGRIYKPKLKPAYLLLLIIIPVFWLLAADNLSKYSLDNKQISTKDNSATLLKEIDTTAASYRLSIVYPDKTVKQYTLPAVGLNVNNTKTLSALLSDKNKLTNKLAWWKPIKVNIVLDKNETNFNNFIAEATQIVVEPAQDANLSISNGQINISNAVTGKEYGLTNSSNYLLQTASSLSESKIKLKALAVNPTVTANELMPYKDQLAKVINQPVSFTIGSQTFKPTTAQVADWLDISQDNKTKKVNIAVNSGKILAYIDGIAAPITAPPKAQVTMTASDGSSQVLVPGQNGIVVSGENTIASSVANSLLSGSGINQSLSVSYKPFETITAGNYPKWIEVDLTNKRLYAYQNSTLVNSFLVSAGAPATPTVVGQYAIYSKYVSQNMTGENVDGSSYYQPNVPWINYFYKDYAIHGNYWRPLSYFGNVNSSHGCVGVIDNQAEWIYNWAPIGTPVITHY